MVMLAAFALLAIVEPLWGHRVRFKRSTAGGLLPESRTVLPPDIVWGAVSLIPPLVAYTDGRTCRLGQGLGQARSLALGRPVHMKQAFFLPDGERLVTSGWRHQVVWNLSSHDWIVGLSLNSLASRALPDGEHVVSLVVTTGYVELWRADSGEPWRRFQVGRHFDKLQVLGSGELLFTWGDLARDSNYPSIFNISSGQFLHAFDPNAFDMNEVDLSIGGRWGDRIGVAASTSPCGEKVLTAHNDMVFLWNARTGALENSAFAVRADERAPVCVSRGGARLFALTDQGVVAWDVATDTDQVLQVPSVNHTTVDFAIDPDGRRVFSFSNHWEDDGVTLDLVWDVETGQALQRLEGRVGGYVETVAVSATGDFVATCVTDRDHGPDFDDEAWGLQVQVWHAVSGRLLHTYQREGQYLTAPGDCDIAIFSMHEFLRGGSES